MSKLTLRFELIEVDHHTRKPLPGVLHEVEIDAEELDARDLDSSLRSNMEEFDASARKAVAARRVDYEASEGDSAYLNLIDKIAGDYYTAGVWVEGAVKKDYFVEGVYPEDGGLWGDTVSAVNASEAEFQAAWTMSENASGSIEKNICSNTTPEQSIQSMLAGMEDQKVISAVLKGVEKDDAIKALAKLAGVARGMGLTVAAIDEAERLIEADKEWASAVSKDQIVYIEEAAAPTM